MTEHFGSPAFSSPAYGQIVTEIVWPDWLPDGVERYLSHTETGLSIRHLARRDNCHASTVLRQIRRVETRRDDPLVDKALSHLAAKRALRVRADAKTDKESDAMEHINDEAALLSDAAELDRAAMRILRRLNESGAVLAVAEGMDMAVVVRESTDGSTTRTASVPADLVQAMALYAWIECRKQGRIARYCITNAGRTKLADLLAQASQSAVDMPFAAQHRDMDEKYIAEDGARKKVRYNAAESPVAALARRKDKSGAPFLSEDLVGAAERLREDFELAQMGPKVAQNWDNFLTGGAQGSHSAARGPASGPGAARDRVAAALRFLGPGLGDVALRCCCYLEGLETAEKRMGWSARSGKIVLRIALQRLSLFYTTHVGEVLIG